MAEPLHIVSMNIAKKSIYLSQPQVCRPSASNGQMRHLNWISQDSSRERGFLLSIYLFLFYLMRFRHSTTFHANSLNFTRRT